VIEDHLLLQQYTMKALSAVLASMIPSGKTGPGVWFGGPYETSGANQFRKILYSPDGTTGTIEYGPIPFQFNAGTHVITIPTPLALAQTIAPDTAGWSTLPADAASYYMIGLLESDSANGFETALTLIPPVAGLYQRVTITGKLVSFQQDGDYSKYNAGDPPNPTVVTAERARLSRVLLTARYGATSATFGQLNTLASYQANRPPVQGAETADPPLAAIPSDETPLFDVILGSGAAGDSDYVCYSLAGNYRIANMLSGHHHSKGLGCAPMIRPTAEIEQATYFKNLAVSDAGVAYPLFPTAAVIYNNNASMAITTIPIRYSQPRALMRIKVNGVFPVTMLVGGNQRVMRFSIWAGVDSGSAVQIGSFDKAYHAPTAQSATLLSVKEPVSFEILYQVGSLFYSFPTAISDLTINILAHVSLRIQALTGTPTAFYSQNDGVGTIIDESATVTTAGQFSVEFVAYDG
jgi:hypothetical protein